MQSIEHVRVLRPAVPAARPLVVRVVRLAVLVARPRLVRVVRVAVLARLVAVLGGGTAMLVRLVAVLGGGTAMLARLVGRADLARFARLGAPGPRVRAIVCAVLVAACGRGPTKGTPAPAPVVEDPARRLTREECGASVDHAIALFEADPAQASAAEMMRSGRDTYIGQCEATATVADRDCLMTARTAEQLGLCPMPGTR